MSFVRDDVPVVERAIQRTAFVTLCRNRGWLVGPTVHQQREGLWAWSLVLRKLQAERCALVAVDSIDRIASTEVGRVAVLALLDRENVRLVAIRDGIDTADTDGRALVQDLISAPGPRPLIRQ
ncbi:hypothetical protein ACG83_21960 [Frankia sp. R43]|uniref:hypothetical protein n=1 Tax=Frankia sp. R43 TaxID=269536 RepID=UPI0006D9D2A0|nr:hypothetical protein [Frankia sp. R43]KPM53807.1 hypothetical protein ACG83_21960 [Frankia sp. R43]